MARPVAWISIGAVDGTQVDAALSEDAPVERELPADQVKSSADDIGVPALAMMAADAFGRGLSLIRIVYCMIYTNTRTPQQ